MTQSTPPPTAFRMQTGEGPLLLADISGYSSFLQDVATAHAHDAFADGNIPQAYAMMSSLLDGIVSSVVPPFTLSKIEGDAVFAYAHLADSPTGAAVMEVVHACYADFRHRLAQAGDLWTCNCDACSRAGGLDLKFILHSGRFFVQEIAGSRELGGPDVVLAHRLLKNGAAESVGTRAYVLLTDAAATRLGMPLDGGSRRTESPDAVPPVEVHVFPLG